MRLDINLLPDHKKNKLEKLINYIFIKELLELILLICVFLAILFLLSTIAVQDQFNNLTQSALLINKDFSSQNQEIKNTNIAIKKLNLASANFNTIGDKLVNFIQTVPNDIIISSLEIDRQNGTFIISGVAKTRDTLLTYQDNLKKIEWLKNVVAPTSQLFEKENISFEIHADLNNLPLIEPIATTQRVINQE